MKRKSPKKKKVKSPRYISPQQLKFKLEGMRIDMDNLVQDLVDERNYWPDNFSPNNKSRLAELRLLAKKVARIVDRIKL